MGLADGRTDERKGKGEVSAMKYDGLCFKTFGLGSGQYWCPNCQDFSHMLFEDGPLDMTVQELIDKYPCQYSFTSEYRNVLSRLDALYNGDRFPGADFPTEQALMDARRLVLAFPLETIHSPYIAFAHDGEINFLWQSSFWQKDGESESPLHIDLGVYGDKTYSYYMRDSKGVEYMADDQKVEGGLTLSLRYVFAEDECIRRSTDGKSGLHDREARSVL